MDRPIILYDGVCNLCNGATRFVIRRDKEGTFLFAALQSDLGRRLVASCGQGGEELSTVILVEEGKCYTRSDAALRIAARLSGLWPGLRILRLMPGPVRDWGYDLVARNRYRWFGRKDYCQMPDQGIRSRFLDLGEARVAPADEGGAVG